MLSTLERDRTGAQSAILAAALTKKSGLDTLAAMVRTERPVRRENDDMDHMADCIRAVAEHGDRSAFADLFAYFAPRLKAFLIKRGASHNEAEEVMQEAMVLVWRKAAQFDPGKASASTWIYTIARNRRIDLIRRAKRPDLDPEDPFFTTISDMPDGEQEYSKSQRAELVRDYLTTLPEEQLLVVRKAFYEEMTHQEIAAELDMPLGTVKSRIRIAMRRLREQLDGVEL